MDVNEKDDIIQTYLNIRRKVKTMEADFVELINLIDGYKTMVLNIEIEKKEEEKKKRWRLWQ